jgi:carbamoyl-phosphate synthase small subunit
MERTGQIAVLALEDGAVFYGRPFGALEAFDAGRRGEVVFATGMTGYHEICTDPSYRGQMVVLTYPLIGNYGVSSADAESRRPWLSALLVREACDEYSNWRATESLDDYLARSGIPGVCELDTRALTRHLRTHGTLRGVLRAYPEAAHPDLDALIAEAKAVRGVSELDVVGEVSCDGCMPWEGAEAGTAGEAGLAPTPSWFAVESAQADFVAPRHSERSVANSFAGPAPRVLLIDTGFKHNIARCLAARGLAVTLAPHDVDLAFVRCFAPEGVLLSNGPGDPENVAHLVAIVHWLLAERIPLMGICLGHQVLGLAIGATTSRLPFGHHGSNHSVKDLRSGRVTVTSQNHNFQVDAASIPAESDFFVSHINLSDGSVEGLAHGELPVFSVQYHPEAAPGPEDNRDLFDQFATVVEAGVSQRTRTAAPVHPGGEAASIKHNEYGAVSGADALALAG